MKRPAENGEAAVTTAQRSRTAASRPNILVTGTPGTGKTRLSEAIAASVHMTHLNVGDVAQRLSAYDGYDEERQCHILNEDKVLDDLEPLVAKGGYVVDYHASDLFPERWFDLVLVVRAKTDVLFDRLSARDYAPAKINENIQCEIMQVLLEEARGAYPAEVVVEVHNNTQEEMDAVLQRVLLWHQAWLRDNSGGGEVRSTEQH